MPTFRFPSHIQVPAESSTQHFRAPAQEKLLGEWYMIRSSNKFWKDKRNVCTVYRNAGQDMEDTCSYQMENSDAIKSISGKDVKCAHGEGMYVWQGKGFLRVASAQWEVLAFAEADETEGKEEERKDWMVVFAQKSIFTSPAVNLMCRSRAGPDAGDVQLIQAWLQSAPSADFRLAVEAMSVIVHD